MFIRNLQRILTNIRNERPSYIVFAGNFNCRSSQWWTEDIQNPEGEALDEFMETNSLYQLVNEPRNIRNESMSCIDLIITDQPNMFVCYGVNINQIMLGNLNFSLSSPPQLIELFGITQEPKCSQ